MKELKPHPLSEIFPLMPPSDIKELADDIKQRGLQNPITLFEGQILDGRHRHEACIIAKIKPRFDQYKGSDPLGFVIAANLKRRHLTTSQKAMVAASIENLPVGRPEKTEKNEIARENGKNNNANLHSARSEIAEVMAISPRSVATASKILDESPKLAAQVRDGKITINKAEEKLAEATEKAKPVLDETGFIIPKEALVFWKRRDEAQKVLTDLSRIKMTLERAKEAQDPLFAKVSNGVFVELGKVHQYFLEAKPYAVCTTCMGSPSVQPKGCSYCGGSGLISKYMWDVKSRQEIKDMRAKIVAART